MTNVFSFLSSEEEIPDTASKNQNPTRIEGVRVSGGISGLASSFHSELEPRIKLDSLLYINQFNSSWNQSGQMRYLNPIGISYGREFGVGTLFAFLETRGIPGKESITGFYPRYQYSNIGYQNGIHAITQNAIQFSESDLGIGYQISYDRFLISPKIASRYFHTNFAQNTLYFGNTTGLGNYDLVVSNSSFFLGFKLQYLVTDVFSIFLEGSSNTLTPANGNESGSFHQINAFTTNIYYYTSATVSQQIIGNRFLGGFQYNVGSLGIQFGYQQESLSTSYSKFISLPVYISGNSFNFNTTQFILDRFLVFKNPMNTEIKFFYLSLVYAL